MSGGARMTGPAGWRRAVPAAVVALVAMLPFARGLLAGQSFFFRDLAGYFLPLRSFAVEGLQQGELRYWNPLVHEGEPLSLPPLAYPPDLLQALIPGPFGISLTLALHVALAALGFMRLAARLGGGRVAAAGGALVYALGGFCVSSLNLYVHLQAVAWAPLVTLGLIQAAEGSRRSLAAAGGLVALALSTMGVEIVAQCVVLAAVLDAGLTDRETRGIARWGRMAAALALGTALSGFVLFHASALVEGSERGRGFDTEVVLAHSVHPLTLLQVLVAGFYGDTSDLTTRWWGQNFFPQGFPYLLSLYLGPAVLALAAVGAACGSPRLRRHLLLLALAAAVACLGRYAGLAALVDALPPLRLFRYPSKLFFLVHGAAALLVTLALDALRRGGSRPWRLAALAAAALGVPLASAPWWVGLWRSGRDWFASGFFPDAYGWPLRLEALSRLLADAALGGTVALCIAGLAALVLARRLEVVVATPAIAGLLAADLLRAGAGLNPMVDAAFFQLSRPMASWAERFREQGARVFTCEPEFQAPFLRLRRERPRGQDAWTFAALAETFTPSHNMAAGVATALSRDRTMLVPVERTLPASRIGCDEPDAIVDPLRRAGVSHVLSVTPLSSPSLRLLATEAPPALAPLRVLVYALEAPLPLRDVARLVRRAADARAAEALARAPGFQAAGGVAAEGDVEETDGATGRVLSVIESSDRLELRVEASRPTLLVVRDAFAPGWAASLDGRTVPVLRADGRHRAVAVPSGTSRVVLEYRPPRQRAGLALSLGAAVVLAALWISGRPRSTPPA